MAPDGIRSRWELAVNSIPTRVKGYKQRRKTINPFVSLEYKKYLSRLNRVAMSSKDLIIEICKENVF
jgi:hypothetical protein